MSLHSKNGKSYIVVDRVPVVLRCIYGGICLLYLFILIMAFSHSRTTLIANIVVLGVIAVLLLLIRVFWLSFKAKKEGFILDKEAGTLEYPGGGNAAATFKSYLTVVYWSQGLKRYSMNISEITEIEIESMNLVYKIMFPYRFLCTNHFIHCKGSFGKVELSFWSKAKRDEVYALLLGERRVEEHI